MCNDSNSHDDYKNIRDKNVINYSSRVVTIIAIIAIAVRRILVIITKLIIVIIVVIITR